MPRPARPARIVPDEITEGVIPTGQRLRRSDGGKVMDRRGVTVDTTNGMTYRFFAEGDRVGIWAGCHYVTVTAEEAVDLGHELLQTGWDVIEARSS
jgi:hypothetical protein